MLKEHFNYYIENLTGAFQEAKEITLGYPRRFSQKTPAAKALSIGKISALPLSIYLTSGTSITTASVLGAATLAMFMTLLRMKNNKHKNAMSAPIAFTNAAQKFILGGTGYAIMASMAGTRGIVMAMLPDTKNAEKLRNRIGLGFAATGISLIGAVAYQKQELWELAPIGSMLLGTLASTKINDKSFQARICHAVANTNNFLYSMIYSGAAGSAMIDLTGLSLASTTIAENDIPQKTKKGVRLNRFQKTTAYISTIFNSSNQKKYLYEDIPESVLNLRNPPFKLCPQ